MIESASTDCPPESSDSISNGSQFKKFSTGVPANIESSLTGSGGSQFWFSLNTKSSRECDDDITAACDEFKYVDMRWEFVLSPVFPKNICVAEFVFALFEVSEINEDEIVIPDIDRLVPVGVVCEIKFGSF